MVQSKLVKVIVTGHQGGKDTLVFDCDESDTVRDLKELVAAELGISSSRIILSHRSVNLRDNASILMYCGRNDIPIHATIAKFVGVGGVQQPQRGYTMKSSSASSKKRKPASSKTKKGASRKKTLSKKKSSASSHKTKKLSSTKRSSKSKKSKKSSSTKSKKSKKSSSYKGSLSSERKKSKKSSSAKASSKK